MKTMSHTLVQMLLTAALCISANAHGQNDDAERKAAAAAVVKASLEQSNAINSILTQMKDQINFVAESMIVEHAKKNNISEDEVMRRLSNSRAAMMAELNKTWPAMQTAINVSIQKMIVDPQLNTDLTDFYMKNYSLAELKELQGYLSSAVVKKNLSLVGQASAIMMPRMSQILGPELGKISTESSLKQTEIVRQYLAKADAAAAKPAPATPAK